MCKLADHVQLLNITVTNAPSHGMVLDGSGVQLTKSSSRAARFRGQRTVCGIRGSSDNNTVQKN